LDGSLLAESALPVARSVAQRAGAKIILVRVPQLPGISVTQPPAYDSRFLVEYVDRYMEAEQRRARDYLEDVRSDLTETGIQSTARLLEGYEPDAIIDAASEDVDLIVMTTHGFGGIRRWALGSVCDKVLQAAPCPVIAFNPGGPPETGPAHALATSEYSISHVVVPLDGSLLGEAVLPAARELTRLFGARLTLLHVPHVPMYGGFGGLTDDQVAQLISHEVKAANNYLARVAKSMASDSLRIETAVPSPDGIASSIISYAHSAAADLIALSTHGRGGLSRWALGSVADRLVRQAHKPVLVSRSVQPQRPAAAE
jgi:nucleotide-binding universal stress UspA family protein